MWKLIAAIAAIILAIVGGKWVYTNYWDEEAIGRAKIEKEIKECEEEARKAKEPEKTLIELRCKALRDKVANQLIGSKP